MAEFKFTLKQWVLVRDQIDGPWALAQFSNMWDEVYVVVGGFIWNYCIPYEGNEHLLGKTDDYVERYLPHDGDFVVSGWEIDGIQCEWIAIVSNVPITTEGFYHSYFDMYTKKAVANDDDYRFGGMCNGSAGYTRPATEEEKHLLLSKLAEIGKEWNPKKKCIEDVWTPHDGDFVVSGWEKGDIYCHWIAICRDYDNDLLFYKTYAILYVRYSSNTGIKEPLEVKYDVCDDHDYTRPATEEEKQFLLAKLAEIGKKWNPEKKKIEDIYQPKDGDFVYVKSLLTGTEYIFIKKVFDGCSLTSHFVLFDVEENALSRVYETCCLDKDIDTIRPATEEEKQLLLDALHKKGKDWDESKKEIVKFRWKPERQDKYFYVSDLLNCASYIWRDDDTDKKQFEIGNCFRTKEEAEAMAAKFKELLKGGKE